MLIRSSRLPANQNAGNWDETPLRIVHQRPPKKIAPSAVPASQASARVRVSFMVAILFVIHCLVFLRNPMPRVEAAKREAAKQQRERPGVGSGMAPVQPDTERYAEQHRHGYRPPDKPH